RTVSTVYVRKGKTTARRIRTCDTVSAGAFFPQPDMKRPEKKRRQECHQHMVMPARVFAHFIVRHPELGFAFFKALFHGPAQSTEPDKGAQGGTASGIAEIVRQ